MDEKLLEFVRSNFFGCEDIIRNIPTYSPRKKMVMAILNSLLAERPECMNTVYALVTYPTQKWASVMREKAAGEGADMDGLLGRASSVIERMDDIYIQCGIRPRLEGVRNECLKGSDGLLGCIEEAVDWLGRAPGAGRVCEMVIRSIHFMEKGCPEVSAYYVRTYYRTAVVCIHEAFGARIDALASDMASSDWLYRPDGHSPEFHDTKTLLRIYPALAHRLTAMHSLSASAMSLQRDADGLSLLSELEGAVGAVRLYPDGGEICHSILTSMMQGKANAEIAKETACCESTFRLNKNKAINLLSFLLWGYSTGRILHDCVFN